MTNGVIIVCNNISLCHAKQDIDDMLYQKVGHLKAIRVSFCYN